MKIIQAHSAIHQRSLPITVSGHFREKNNLAKEILKEIFELKVL